VREFQRGAVRLHILHHAAEQEVHGAWMTKELARHGYDISPGTLYPTLHRLEAEGLLSSVQRLVDGRTRRLYRVTEAGKRALREDRKALEELAREVLGAQIAPGGGPPRGGPESAAARAVAASLRRRMSPPHRGG
jgi:DNA-binding PadR family transcriptional regulator